MDIKQFRIILYAICYAIFSTFISSCNNETGFNYYSKFVYTNHDEIRVLDLVSKKESILLRDTTSIHLGKIIKLSKNIYIFESLDLDSDSLKLSAFLPQSKIYYELVSGSNPIRISDEEFIYFRNNKKTKKNQLFKSDLKYHDLYYEFNEDFIYDNVIKIGDTCLVFFNKNNELMKFNIKNKTIGTTNADCKGIRKILKKNSFIKNTDIYNIYPVFYSENRGQLYCNYLHQNKLYIINMINGQKDSTDQLFSSIYIYDNNHDCVYYQDDVFNIFPIIGESTNLVRYDFKTKSEFLIKKDVRFHGGFFE